MWRDSLRIPMNYFYAWYPSCLIDICDIAHLQLWCDSFSRVPWPNGTCDMTHSQGDMISLYLCYMYDFTSVFHMCDTTLTYVWHDPLLCVTRLYYMCDMTHCYVWHDKFSISQSHAWHDSSICVSWLHLDRCTRNTPQHTATHHNTLQHTATHCSTLQHSATHRNTLQHTATQTILICGCPGYISTGV